MRRSDCALSGVRVANAYTCEDLEVGNLLLDVVVVVPVGWLAYGNVLEVNGLAVKRLQAEHALL